MSDLAIRVENLGKQYRIGGKPTGYRTFREALLGSLAAPVRWMRGERKAYNTFWALDDVSFDIKQGEAVGIIGRNGAGKSTLLKILSRITKPTKGQVDLYGRVSSLLEVGTGFHPELSGRDNIYLNGAILGMNRTEINKNFDAIVDFSGVEKFLDTPVKHYSSGMYVRLAFAVAAHLETEILVVDEVLAVGDAEFQKKCLGKMGDVAHEGRTVLFVSHNMAAIENLCLTAILLKNGNIQFYGNANEAISNYLSASIINDLDNIPNRKGSGEIRIESIYMTDGDGRPIDTAMCGQDIEIRLKYKVTSPHSFNRVLVGISAKTQFGTPLFLHHNRITREYFGEIRKNGVFICRINKLPLIPSSFVLDFSVMADMGYGDYYDSATNVFNLQVTEGNYFKNGELPPATHGIFAIDASWRCEQQN